MLGLGIGPGMGHAGSAGGPGPSLPSSNPNLFLFPEDYTNAAWTKPAVTVSPNYGDPTYPTADQLDIPTPRLVQQVTDVAGTTGGGTGNITLTGAWATYSLTKNVDGLPYTLTANALSISGAVALRLEIGLSGGFIYGRLSNQSGSTASMGLAWMKLEQSASFSGYP